jgi:peptidoglycan/LPS O-acetylase OafA/YrhL
VIRRIVSTVFFVLGGWLLLGEPIIAFIDFGPDARPSQFFLILGVLTFVSIPLLIATAISPGHRRRELGLTILIAVGVALVSGASAAVVFTDPGFMQFMPPMPKIGFAPLAGAVNLLIVAAVGWLLYRTGRGEPEAAPGSSPE